MLCGVYARSDVHADDRGRAKEDASSSLGITKYNESRVFFFFFTALCGGAAVISVISGIGREGDALPYLAEDPWRGSSRINHSLARRAQRRDGGFPQSHWKNPYCVLGPDSLYRISKVVRGWFCSNPEPTKSPNYGLWVRDAVRRDGGTMRS